MKAIFKVEKECKHSRRYRSIDKKFPIITTYIKKEFSNGKDEIVITLEENNEQ